LGRKATALILGAMIACIGVFAFSTSQAQAAPFTMPLTNGQLNLGFAFKGAKIMPAPAQVQLSAPPAAPTNLPNLWNARETTNVTNPTAAYPLGCLTPAQLNITVNPPAAVGPPLPACTGNPPGASVAGDLTGSAVTITSSPQPTTPAGPLVGLGAVPGANPPVSWGLPSGFRFPIMIVPNPLDNSPVPVTIAATGNVTGTFDSGTGALSLNGPIEARVLTGLATAPLQSYCALPLTGLSLSTTSNADFPGVPFTSGLSGNGAITGTYNITADATSVGGANCATVNQVSKGAGSIWLSNGIAEPPTCPANTTGIPPNCVPDPCPAGTVGTAQPDCAPAKATISRVAVSGPSKARRGTSAKFRVKITNSGNIPATGVRLRVSGKGVAVNSSVGEVAAGATRTVNVRVRFRSTGRIKGTFRVTSSNAGSKTVNRSVRVTR
jgi:hypothetical protein